MKGIVSPTQTDEWNKFHQHKLMNGFVSATQTDEWNCFTNTN
jgi:hypothetical protein